MGSVVYLKQRNELNRDLVSAAKKRGIKSTRVIQLAQKIKQEQNLKQLKR